MKVWFRKLAKLFYKGVKVKFLTTGGYVGLDKINGKTITFRSETIEITEMCVNILGSELNKVGNRKAFTDDQYYPFFTVNGNIIKKEVELIG